MSALRLSDGFAAWAQAAAALVNTAPRATDPREKLTSAGDVRALLARCPERPPAAGPAEIAALRELRPALRDAIEAPTLVAFAAAVNPLLARGASGWHLAPDGDGAWDLRPGTADGLGDWFGVRAARGLAELAIAYGVERIHVCHADDCLRAVVDVSRNGTRRYCSRTCANRTNARRHRGVR